MIKGQNGNVSDYTPFIGPPEELMINVGLLLNHIGNQCLEMYSNLLIPT